MFIHKRKETVWRVIYQGRLTGNFEDWQPAARGGDRNRRGGWVITEKTDCRIAAAHTPAPEAEVHTRSGVFPRWRPSGLWCPPVGGISKRSWQAPPRPAGYGFQLAG